MSEDNVSTSGAEGRKQTSKPVMEKRRRARINTCLVELKSLLMEVIKSEGTRQSKMEKADILEMTVRHLRQLQRQSITGTRSVDPTTQNKYRLGYTECINEVSRFLGSLDLEEVELRTKIIDHLANCVCSSKFYEDDLTPSTSTFPYNTAVVKPRIETASSSEKLSTPARTNTTHLPIAPKPNIRTETNGSFVFDIACKERSPEHTSCVYASDRAVQRPNTSFSNDSDQIQTALNLTTYSTHSAVNKPLPQLHVPLPLTSVPSSSSDLCNIRDLEHSPNTSKLPLIKPAQSIEKTVQSNSSIQPMSSLTSSSLFSGFQIVPTKLPSGELAFVLPANLLSSTQTPSYIIPVFSQNVPATNTQSQQLAISSVSAVPVIQPSVLPISGIRPLILNPATQTLQSISSSLPHQQIPSPGRLETPSMPTVSDNKPCPIPFRSKLPRMHLPHTVSDNNNNDASMNSEAGRHGAGTSKRDELSHSSRTQTRNRSIAGATGFDACSTMSWSQGVSFTGSTNEINIQPGTSVCRAMDGSNSQELPVLNSRHVQHLDNDRRHQTDSDVDRSRDQNSNASVRPDDQDDDDMWRPW